jgi:hypothetical protein
MEEILSPEQWKELQIMLKIKFPELSDDDLHYHESYENDLLRMVGYSIKKDIVHMQGLFSIPQPAPPYIKYPVNGGIILSGQRVKVKHKLISI